MTMLLRVRTRTVVAVLLFAAAVAAVWIYFRVFSKAPPPKTPPPPAAMILGDLINNANYELRSLQLGRWFVDQLRAELREGRSCDEVDHDAIVARLPGANAVTRSEQTKHLRALLAMACEGQQSPLAMLDSYEAMLAPDAALAVMYAYAARSSAPLP